jgi:hypothetical protein
MNDGCKIKLSTLVVGGERAFQYLYDYGDGWCLCRGAGSRRADAPGRRQKAKLVCPLLCPAQKARHLKLSRVKRRQFFSSLTVGDVLAQNVNADEL